MNYLCDLFLHRNILIILTRSRRRVQLVAHAPVSHQAACTSGNVVRLVARKNCHIVENLNNGNLRYTN